MGTRYRLLFAVVLICATILHAQSKRAAQSPGDDLITNLLKLPAPAPFTGSPGGDAPRIEVSHVNVRPAGRLSAPADDAPLDVLGRYWAQMVNFSASRPDAKISRRLLESCESQPELLPALLQVLPQDSEANERIKAIYDKNETKFDDNWRKQVREYLELHSDFFHDELLSEAREAHDNNLFIAVEHSKELETLAVVDWPRAEPLLKELAAGKQPRTAVLAQTLIYRHFVTAGDEVAAVALRSQLMQVVSDRKALGYSRNKAAELLLATNWTGRDEWYLSLFHDPTMHELSDGWDVFAPLTAPVHRDPDHWIPTMVRMVGDEDRAAHDAAVSCLIQFQLTSARRDALTPLLPWLMDPNWASVPSDPQARLRLIQSVDRLDMTDSIPGLISVLGEVGDSAERSYAAEALVYFRDSRAVPALRIALGLETFPDDRQRIIRALFACHGVSPAEEAKDVEAFAESTLTIEGTRKWEVSEKAYDKMDFPVGVVLGGYIADIGPENDNVVETLVKRVEELRRKRADLAQHLQSLIAEWPSRPADLAIVRHIRDGFITPQALEAALQRREFLQNSVNAELRKLENMRGFAPGFAAVLLADRQKELAILSSGKDVNARKALLASARLVREKLPVDDVAKLRNSGDVLLDAAIDGYLETEDSPEARTLYLAWHKGEARILGAGQSFDSESHSFGDFDQVEEHLRDEIKNDAEGNEIYALLSEEGGQSAEQTVIRVNPGGAEITFVEDPARYYTREMTSAEWEEFHRFIHENQVENLGPLDLATSGGTQYEYVHVTRDGGRRVFMNNPGLGSSGGTAYDRLCATFRDLLGAAHLDLHYRMAEKIAGFETLFADDTTSVGTPWKEGDDLRMSVYSNERSQGVISSDTGPLVVLPRPRRKQFTWVTLRDGRLNRADQPDVFPPDDPEGVVPENLENIRKMSGADPDVWPLTVNGKTYRRERWNGKSGLWQFAPGQDPKLMVEGDFSWPVITSDGKWALLMQRNTTWAYPNFVVVRVDLATGESFKLDIPEADKITPITYVAARDAVLVKRFQESHDNDNRAPVGPKTPEFWLIDASTGKRQIVHGEFSPLEQIGARPLQAAATKGLVWAAIYRDTEGATEIGTYNATDFVFTPVLSVPGLNFDSQAMWVDEAEHKAYIAYKGQLLRISVPDSAH